MAWIRGETGNPFIRRNLLNVNAFQNLCRDYAPKAFSLLREIVEDPLQEGSVRMQGLKFMVEHAYGKARQSIDFKVEEQVDPGMMSQAQLMLAADGQTEELVCSLMESGKLNEYTRRYEGVVQREEKDITEVKDDHLGKIVKVAKAKIKDMPKKAAKAKVKSK